MAEQDRSPGSDEDATEHLAKRAGESLIALGLYTACFEALMLAFRRKVKTYLALHEPTRLEEFDHECKSAARTFAFCGPLLVKLGALQQNDLATLKNIRLRRNSFVHESPFHILTLTLASLDDDLRRMHQITRQVCFWTVTGSEEAKQYPGMRVSFDVESAFVTSFARLIAADIVAQHFGTD